MSNGLLNSDSRPAEPRTKCPSAEMLQAFTEGSLSLADLKAVSTHLLRCETCETKLSSIFEEVEKTERTRSMAKGSHGRVVDSVNSPVGTAVVESSVPGAPRSKSAEVGSEATMPLQLGQYRLLRQIGRGGMGVVYKAWHERLRREVALKLLPSDQFDDPVGIERMQREMAATGTLRHPNIVYATDAGEAEGVHYLVMEYVPGIDLARLVARLGPLPVADACEMARQAAQGLEHIRDQGMVHRDLKPSNLILSVDGTVKILDLGLARLRPDECDQDQLTRKNYLLGTADFVAPEQAVDSHTADIRSDIYSLGCTLYKLLNGEPLYGGDKYATWTRKIEAHQRAPLPPLAGPRQQVPEELQAVLRKALAKNVADRYQTPGDFARALAPFARTHHLSTLLRQVDLVPEPSTLPPATPGAGSPLADTSQGPMPASEGKRGKGLSRVHLLIIATSVAFGLCGIILALSYFKSNAPTVSDAKEIGFNALRGESSLVIDPRAGSITVNAPATRQLVSLGKWTAPQGHFAATIEQSDHFWNGDVGFFFGYREEPVRGRAPPGSPKLVGGVLQLIYLHRCELPGQPPQLRWRRQLVQIDPMTQSFNLLSSAIVQGPPFPANPSKIRVAISIDGSGISSFKMNDVEISELSNGSDNQRFKPQDYQGPMGLYNYGENGSRFTAFDLSSLRKE